MRALLGMLLLLKKIGKDFLVRSNEAWWTVSQLVIRDFVQMLLR